MQVYAGADVGALGSTLHALVGPRTQVSNTHGIFFFFFFTRVTGPRRSLSLKMSEIRVYEPPIRARLGTTAHLVSPCRLASSGPV